MKKNQLFAIVFLLSVSLFGQNDTARKLNLPHQATDVNETILNYEKFLREEATNHRTFTQEYYSMILTLFTGIGIIVGAIFTWMNWKSKESIKKQIDEQFKERVQIILDEKLLQVDIVMKNLKEKTAKQFEEVNNMIIELSLKSAKAITQNTQLTDHEQLSDITQLKGKRILWVDDDPKNNEYPIKILSQKDVVFDLAVDTETGLKLLNKNKYDLVISDMSRGNNRSAGLDLIRTMKQRNIDIPIIIFASSNALKAYGEEAIKSGAYSITSSITGALNSIQQILALQKNTG